jgi:KDO2-lipid IV(A) lauroyltransferase
LVVPFKAVRRDDNLGYELRIEPPLEHFPSGDPEADAARINAILERWVRESPAHYLWIHRRFRTRPRRGDPSPYDAAWPGPQQDPERRQQAPPMQGRDS